MRHPRSTIVGVAALLILAACGSESSVSQSVTVTEAPTSNPAEQTIATEPIETTEAPDNNGAPEAPVAPDNTETEFVGELSSIGLSGFSTWKNSSGETLASAGAAIVNNSDEDLFYTEVTFNFIGADGTAVATESAYVEVIPAGNSFPALVGTYTDLTAAMPVTVEITAFAETNSFMESEWVEMEVGPTALVSGEYSTTVTGTVTNPSDEPLEFYPVVCLILNADGNVVGGATAYPNRVAPGQTIAWEAWVEDGPMQAGGSVAECRSIATLS
jgi:hypothetical protein